MWLLTWSSLRAHKGRFTVVLLCLSALLLMLPAHSLSGVDTQRTWNRTLAGRWLVAHLASPDAPAIGTGIPLPGSTVDTLLHMPGVDPSRSGAMLTAFLTWSDIPFAVIGMEPGLERTLLGEAAPLLQAPAGREPLLLSAGVAASFGVQVGDPVRLWGRDWHVAGVLTHVLAPDVLLPLAPMQDMLHVTGATAVILAGTPDPAALAVAAGGASRIGPHGPYPTLMPEWAPPTSWDRLIFVGFVFALMAVIATYASALATEQVGHIGVLRSLGFGRFAAALPIVLETAVLVAGAAILTAVPKAMVVLVQRQQMALHMPDWPTSLEMLFQQFLLLRLAPLSLAALLAVAAPFWRGCLYSPATRLRPMQASPWTAIVGITSAATFVALASHISYTMEVSLSTDMDIDRTALVVTRQSPAVGFSYGISEMSAALADDLLSTPGVDRTRSGALWERTGVLPNKNSFLLYGIDETLFPEYFRPAKVAAGQIDPGVRGSIVLGAVLARDLGGKPGDEVRLFGAPWRVQAVLAPHPFYDNHAVVRRPEAVIAYQTTAHATEVALYPNSSPEGSDLAVSVQARWPDLSLLTAEAHQQYHRSDRVFARVLNGTATIAMTIAAFTVVMVSYSLRANPLRRRSGILRALGAPRTLVFWHLLGQAALLAAISGALSILALQFANRFQSSPISASGYSGALVILAAAILGGIFPTVRTLRSSVASALRGD